MFRINRASKPFIFITFGIYIVAQGLGFGILFTILKAIELITIFAIGGGIFIAMAAAGYLAKNLMGMAPFLIAGTIVIILSSLIAMILYFAGIYSDVFIMIITFGSGVLFAAYTAFDVNMIKLSSQYNNLTEDDDHFRLVMFFGFKLLIDLISLI